MWLIKDKILYIESFLSEYEMESLDSLILEHQHDVDKIMEEFATSDRGGYKTFPANSPMLSSIHNRIFKLVKNELSLSFEEFYPRDELQFLHPPSDQSLHFDGSPGSSLSFGTVLYLSDPSSYGGGEIFYPEYDIEIKPAKGSLALHTSDVEHGVKMVTHGMRFVSVAFFR